MFGLPKLFIIFNAELHAILKTLIIVRLIKIFHQIFLVCSDTLSAFEAIINISRHPLICKICSYLFLLSQKGTNVTFCWVPSLVGITGNERADAAAIGDCFHPLETTGAIFMGLMDQPSLIHLFSHYLCPFAQLFVELVKAFNYISDKGVFPHDSIIMAYFFPLLF